MEGHGWDRPRKADSNRSGSPGRILEPPDGGLRLPYQLVKRHPVGGNEIPLSTSSVDEWNCVDRLDLPRLGTRKEPFHVKQSRKRVERVRPCPVQNAVEGVELGQAVLHDTMPAEVWLRMEPPGSSSTAWTGSMRPSFST